MYEIQERLGKVTLIILIALTLNFIISLALVVRFGSIGVAIGTAASYLLSQTMFVLDQHKYLKISTKRILILLIFCICFGVLQCVTGENYLLRIGTATLSFACLIALVRHFSFIDRAILTHILSGKLLTFQPFFCWLFIRQREKTSLKHT